MQVDLTGGYYDSGDNVKFGLPMAFTVAALAWSVVEYGGRLDAAGELGHALDAVRWGADYLARAHASAGGGGGGEALYVQVGDGDSTTRAGSVRGHGHAPHGLHGDRLQPRLRRRRRDGRRARRRRRRAHARRRQLLVHAPGARQTGTTFLHAQCNLI